MNPYYDEFKSIAQGRQWGGYDDQDIGYVYKANMRQRGYGLCDGGTYKNKMQIGLGVYDTLAGLWQFAKPYIKSGLQRVGQETVDTIATVAKDMIVGKPGEESFKKHVTKRAKELFAKPPQLAKKKQKKGAPRRRAVISSKAFVGSGLCKKQKVCFPLESDLA